MSVPVDLERITALFTKVVDPNTEAIAAASRRTALGAKAQREASRAETVYAPLLSHQRATNIGITFAKLKVRRVSYSVMT